jgi:membrane-associated phospholipid phosphatase
VLKYGVGRARPTAGLGTTEFKPGSKDDLYHSFPSNHTVAMWAAVTPYAKEYDMPWLYGVAALTNVARVGSREHWVSDTVGGAAIGYVLGYLAWDTRREARLRKNTPQVLVSPNSVDLAWKLD